VRSRPPALSIVLSFRNEDAVLPELLRRLKAAVDPIGGGYEVIFVNDASTDGSLPFLAAEAARDPRVKVLTMSRPFGPAECAMAGLAYASGEAAVLMDADLQDPPELLRTLVARWREGADVVFTVRTMRHGESRLKMLITRAGYYVLRAASNIDLPIDAGDFRLMSRRVVDHLLSLRERTPYLRGLSAWVGFKQVAVPYEREPRFAGRTHYPLLSPNPWRTFLSGVTSFSWAPLVLMIPLGVLLLIASTAAGLFVLADGRDNETGTLIAVAVAALAGVQLTGLGLIGAYVVRIHDDVRGRPRYIVDTTIGFDEPAGD
jgi:dolichol-phosphate mannosyltransferase